MSSLVTLIASLIAIMTFVGIHWPTVQFPFPNLPFLPGPHVVSPTVSPSPTSTPIPNIKGAIYDDQYSGADIQIKFSPSGWAHRQIGGLGYFGNTFSQSTAPNATMSVTFVGSQIELVGTLYARLGRLEVKMSDTCPAKVVSEYLPGDIKQANIYTSCRLPHGQHVMTVTSLGQGDEHDPAKASDTAIEVDGLIVAP